MMSKQNKPTGVNFGISIDFSVGQLKYFEKYGRYTNKLIMEDPGVKMNLGDPELELIDPTPNIYSLFINFDKLFFWSKLTCRAVVRWSKRMYSCAGICSYEGREGLCDIALSEPLLKLRPRKDLVETLLHEMIHAYLFITSRDRDRDGHGPSFQAHMHRINKMAGLNITIYHDFHDEVNLYLTHWWRCDGPCQKRKPYFGVIRKTCNRAPGPTDYWWDSHQRTCGGTFVKIKEPEKQDKKKASNPTLKKPSYPDIRKYINNKTTQTIETYMTPTADKQNQPVLNTNNKNGIDKYVVPTINKQPKVVLKDTSNTLPNNNFANNNHVNNYIRNNDLRNNNLGNNNLENYNYANNNLGNNNLGNNNLENNNPGNINLGNIDLAHVNIGNKAYILKARIFVKGNVNNPPVMNQNVNNPPVMNQNVNTFSPPIVKKSPSIFDHNGNVNSGRQRTQFANVAETVRNVWANKEIPTASNSKIDASKQESANSIESIDTKLSNKHKYEKLFSDDSPPYKVKKVETDEELAMSVLKDVYGKDIKVSRADTKLVATTSVMVDCPICKVKVEADNINAHLDECLNTDVIKNMFKVSTFDKTDNTNLTDTALLIPDTSFDKSKKEKAPMIKSNTIPDFDGNHKKQSVNINTEKDDDLIDLPDVSFIKKENNVVNINPPKHVSIDYNMPSTSKQNTFTPRDITKTISKEMNNNKLFQKSGHVKSPVVKTESGDDIASIEQQKCPCCALVIDKSIEEHFDECLAFFENNATIPQEGTSTSFVYDTVTIEDDYDDVFDETQTLNATGTKNPCPCCMQMVEQADMNNHLDVCLFS